MILIGFMGSGKSTVAHSLSDKMNLPLIDLDKEVVRMAGMEIREIFETEGEAGFRRREFEALDQVGDSECIVATGGGVVTYAPSRRLLQNMNVPVVYLHADFDTLYTRIKDDSNRPLVRSREQVNALYEQRLHIYRSAADHEIDCSASVEAVVSKLLAISQIRRV
ncbi:shikimate kinase [Salinicoccus sp. ID82-1]|uniref:shikimate kinase n=1 Tax=Salinicoccus sp. ID82-1 TaxID=2820269 RepID=UPI001F3CCABE|nr:shikimate kinase [Salinicoccus sp. ID82-1]MCG1009024.1 shikimate kinase [Salinicoccus sp. ID82-1]